MSALDELTDIENWEFSLYDSFGDPMLFRGGVIIADALQELAALRARTTWQPIESAPVKPKGFYLGQIDGCWTKMSWDYNRDGWIDYFTDDFFEPTHWMPIPELP